MYIQFTKKRKEKKIQHNNQPTKLTVATFFSHNSVVRSGCSVVLVVGVSRDIKSRKGHNNNNNKDRVTYFFTRFLVCTCICCFVSKIRKEKGRKGGGKVERSRDRLSYYPSSFVFCSGSYFWNYSLESPFPCMLFFFFSSEKKGGIPYRN